VSDAAKTTEIVPAEDMALVRALFLEYQTWLNVDLCFQDFEAELATLPGRYAPPRGGLWFATADGETAGVVGIRPLAEDGICEMKRLWVRPGFRGLKLGWRLAETAVAAARTAGYRSMVLDTLPSMGEAGAIYARLGFREIPAYYHNPLEGVRYLQLELHRHAASSG